MNIHTRNSVMVGATSTGLDKRETPHSVSEAFSQLAELQQEFEMLVKPVSEDGPESTRFLACDTRIYLQQARVLLLCANVEGAVLKIGLATQNLRQLRQLFIKTKPRR
ncbi:MAG: hypothetical protein NTZ35_11940 [Ignavibacteriales bacterium]|nr:hypothetical protein [Ignavibacteriales bacterium]